MELKKVNAINYDKKDCDLIVCPKCKSSNFSLFLIMKKSDKTEHFHVRCIFCDLTFCPELEFTISVK